MAEKRTMTLNLTDAEMTVLEELAAKKNLTKTAVIRQAIRLRYVPTNLMIDGFLQMDLLAQKVCSIFC